MKDKITCGVVRDLIPLVADEVCGEESREAVEEHVKTCESCLKALSDARAAMPAPVTDEKAAKGFKKALKKEGRRFRLWQIAAAVLAAVVLIVCTEITAHSEILYNIDTAVPIAWMKDAHLVRTEQGAILLQFTPDEAYRHFFGGCAMNGVWDEKYQQVTAYQYTFDYPWLAKLLNRDFNNEKYTARYAYVDQYVIRLSNGDWAFAAMNALCVNYVWQEGRIWAASDWSLTQEEIKALLAEGVPVDGNTEVVKYNDPWPEGVKMELKGPNDVVTLYQVGDDIPLCDAETQEKFDLLSKNNAYYFHAPGEVIHYRDTDGENRTIEYVIQR